MLALVGVSFLGTAVVCLVVLIVSVHTGMARSWLTNESAERVTLGLAALLTIGVALALAGTAGSLAEHTNNRDWLVLAVVLGAFAMMWLWLRSCARLRLDRSAPQG